MKINWPTKTKDMLIAQLIMEEYAYNRQIETLGLFELVVNLDERRMNFRLANWVLALVDRFNTLYGVNQGDIVTRQVISCCMMEGQTLH